MATAEKMTLVIIAVIVPGKSYFFTIFPQKKSLVQKLHQTPKLWHDK